MALIQVAFQHVSRFANGMAGSVAKQGVGSTVGLVLLSYNIGILGVQHLV